MMKIGELVKLSTPDDDDGKVGLLRHRIFDGRKAQNGHDEVVSYGVQILGETEVRDYLIWEVGAVKNVPAR